MSSSEPIHFRIGPFSWNCSTRLASCYPRHGRSAKHQSKRRHLSLFPPSSALKSFSPLPFPTSAKRPRAKVSPTFPPHPTDSKPLTRCKDHGEEPDPCAATVGGGAQKVHDRIGGGAEDPGGERAGGMEAALPPAVGTWRRPGGDRDGDAGSVGDGRLEGNGTPAYEAHPRAPQVPPPRARPRGEAKSPRLSPSPSPKLIISLCNPIKKPFLGLKSS